jgi:fructokinase
VIVTLGKKGAFAVNKKHEIVEVTANEIAVIDTIGAGDTFAAALITQLLEKSWINKNALENLSSDDLTEILTNCSAASAITCSRQGANPPHRHEVSW